MSILIANVGTSDIAIKVDAHYLPLGFDRNEINLKAPDPSTPEGISWHERKSLVENKLSETLRLPPKTRYRHICKALLAAYKKDPDCWHPRISIGRILGIINSVLKTETQEQSKKIVIQIYLIVTDQPETEEFGHPNDSVHAFDIIQQWLERENSKLPLKEYQKLELQKKVINVPAINEDLLHEYYYNLFQEFGPNDTLYLSVKGGTTQMQQALKVQALASNTKAQIFLSPRPDVIKILAGQPSDCQPIVYWRYQQNQRFQTVNLLLQQWDFQGAALLLQAWQESLQSLITEEQSKLQEYFQQIDKVLYGLNLAVAHLNLDLKSTVGYACKVDILKTLLEHYSSDGNDSIDSGSLYAQCRIYDDLGQIAHFLIRLGSFYETSQRSCIKKLGGTCTRQIDKNRKTRGEYIQQLMAEKYQMMENHPDPMFFWEKLDFWYKNRNQIAHNALGINADRIQEVYDQRKDIDTAACPYDEILLTMQQILHEIDRIDCAEESKTIMQAMPYDDYGLYGAIREWAIATLQTTTSMIAPPNHGII